MKYFVLLKHTGAIKVFNICTMYVNIYKNCRRRINGYKAFEATFNQGV